MHKTEKSDQVGRFSLANRVIPRSPVLTGSDRPDWWSRLISQKKVPQTTPDEDAALFPCCGKNRRSWSRFWPWESEKTATAAQSQRICSHFVPIRVKAMATLHSNKRMGKSVIYAALCGSTVECRDLKRQWQNCSHRTEWNKENASKPIWFRDVRCFEGLFILSVI